MKKTTFVIATLVAAGLAGAPLAAMAASQKTKGHHAATSSTTTTGSNMKSSGKSTNVSPDTKSKSGSMPSNNAK
jgi:hypothetical protein